MEQVKPVFEHVLCKRGGQEHGCGRRNLSAARRNRPHHHAPSAFIYRARVVRRHSPESQVDDQAARSTASAEGFYELPGSHHRISENASDTEPASLLAVVVDSTDSARPDASRQEGQ